VTQLFPKVAAAKGATDFLRSSTEGLVNTTLRRWGIDFSQQPYPDQHYNDSRSPTTPVPGLWRPDLGEGSPGTYLGKAVYDRVLTMTGERHTASAAREVAERAAEKAAVELNQPQASVNLPDVGGLSRSDG
jgi:hypothetical protein